MGGVSSRGVGGGGGGRMAGIGSDPNYNPNGGGYGDAFGGVNQQLDGVISALGAGISSLGEYGRSGFQQASATWSDPKKMDDLTSTVRSTSASFWGSLTSVANKVASNLTEPDDDGLADFQNRMAAERQSHRTVDATNSSKYTGFGSDTATGGFGQQNAYGNMNTSNNYSAGTSQASFNRPIASAPASAPLPPIMNNKIPQPPSSGGPKTMGATKMKVEGTGDDFFASFGA